MATVGPGELVILGIMLLVPAAVVGVLAYLFLFKAKKDPQG